MSSSHACMHGNNDVLYMRQDGQSTQVTVDFVSPKRILCAGLARSHPSSSLKRRRAIILTSGWAPMLAAYDSLPGDLRPRLLMHPRPIPHRLLLPACAALVHPGGAGTVAAALVSGCPQLLFPLHYDQSFWAERLAYLGLSPPALDAELLFNHTQHHHHRPPGASERSVAARGPAARLPHDDSREDTSRDVRLLVERLTECFSSGVVDRCRQIAKV